VTRTCWFGALDILVHLPMHAGTLRKLHFSTRG